MNGTSREHHALREHSFIQNTDTRLDEFIAQGRAVLDDLVDQRNVLKGTQRRLLDAANTLGLSRDVIGWIERRRSVCRISCPPDSDADRDVQYAGHVHLLCGRGVHVCLLLLYMEISGLILASVLPPSFAPGLCIVAGLLISYLPVLSSVQAYARSLAAPPEFPLIRAQILPTLSQSRVEVGNPRRV